MSLLVDVHFQRSDFRLNACCDLAGGMLGVYGPSGSGKSTLLHLLAGLIKPTGGTIQLDQTVLADPQQHIFVPPHRRQVGIVFQDNKLWPRKTVRQNIAYGYKLVPAHCRHLDPAQTARLLKIDRLLDRRAYELSGGEQKRVAIARAILCFPKLLLLDEPTAGLAPKLVDQTLPLLKQVAAVTGVPIMIVSHQLSELLSLTDHLLLMRDITLAMSPVETITMQNRLPGVVRHVREQNHRHFCVVALEESDAQLLVEVTQQAINDFDLRAGVRTWCLFKASALQLHADAPTSDDQHTERSAVLRSPSECSTLAKEQSTSRDRTG